MDIQNVVLQSKALTGQNKSNAGQQALIEAYQEATRDQEVPDPPHGGWDAWIRYARQTGLRLSNLKQLWLWNSL